MTLFQPIIGERQCRACGECKPETEFYFDGHRLRRKCKACCVAAARRRYKPKAAVPRVGAWPECDLAIVRQFYPQGGANACLPYLPAGIRRQQVVGVANRIGVRCETYKVPHDTDEGNGWAVPMHDERERAECVRLRNWRYPVQPASLRATLGVVNG